MDEHGCGQRRRAAATGEAMKRNGFTSVELARQVLDDGVGCLHGRRDGEICDGDMHKHDSVVRARCTLLIKSDGFRFLDFKQTDNNVDRTRAPGCREDRAPGLQCRLTSPRVYSMAHIAIITRAKSHHQYGTIQFLH